MSATDLTAEMVMQAAEECADRMVREARKSAPSVAMKECPRCGGKGYDFFLGADAAPADCFKCLGHGKVIANKSDRDMLAKRDAQVEVERLRVLWRGHTMALSMLRGGMHGARFGLKQQIEQHERALSQIAKMGKEAAAKAA